MLLDSKRLIWTDTTSTTNHSSKHFINDEEAHIYISSIGKGYIDVLYTNIDYIQEVMMDTSVNTDHFGSGWQPQFITDRLPLVLRFCEYLFRQEVIELKKYFSKNVPDTYEDIFGDRSIISLEIMEKVSSDVEIILKFVINHSKSDKYREEINELENQQSSIYHYRIQEAKDLQQKLFN